MVGEGFGSGKVQSYLSLTSSWTKRTVTSGPSAGMREKASSRMLTSQPVVYSSEPVVNVHASCRLARVNPAAARSAKMPYSKSRSKWRGK